jgi:carbonic anhydrase
MIWPLLFSLFSVCTLSYAKSNIITLAGPGTVDWGYLKKTLPTDWGNIDSRCNGVRQSPINILTARTVYDRSLKDIIIRRQDVTSAAENWQLERTSYGGK